MMPFKTVMTPNFKLEQNNAWGKQYTRSEYPVRNMKKIELFDIKGFVNSIREKKFNDLMGNMGDSKLMP